MGPAGFEPATSRLSAGCSSQTKLWARLSSPISYISSLDLPFLMPTSPVRERREALLSDPRVARWYKSRRSESTAQAQLAQLELFLRRTSLTLDDLVRVGKEQKAGQSRKFEDVVLSWIGTERKAGRPDAYLSTNWAAVRSLLKHEEAAPDWTPKFKIRAGETLMAEVVPTPEQLREVLDRTSTPRTRAVILFLATTGVRIGVLGSRYSALGLRLKHLPELKLGEECSFEKVPFRVDVPAELSKGGQAYFAFGTEEAASAIVAYLDRRTERGELLTPESALLAPEPKTSTVHLRRAPDGVAFLSEKGVADEIRTALARTQPKGVRWRPYVLRSFASSQMMVAENAGLITRDAREFLLGHTADIGRRYNLGKGRVRSDLVEEVRAMYAQTADKFLRITSLTERTLDYRPLLRVLLGGVGYSKSDIDAMGELTEESVINAIRAKRPEGREIPAPKPGENARVVAVSELDAFLSKGWRPIAAAGNERFVVAAPN